MFGASENPSPSNRYYPFLTHLPVKGSVAVSTAESDRHNTVTTPLPHRYNTSGRDAEVESSSPRRHSVFDTALLDTHTVNKVSTYTCIVGKMVTAIEEVSVIGGMLVGGRER